MFVYNIYLKILDKNVKKILHYIVCLVQSEYVIDYLEFKIT